MKTPKLSKVEEAREALNRSEGLDDACDRLSYFTVQTLRRLRNVVLDSEFNARAIDSAIRIPGRR